MEPSDRAPGLTARVSHQLRRRGFLAGIAALAGAGATRLAMSVGAGTSAEQARGPVGQAPSSGPTAPGAGPSQGTSADGSGAGAARGSDNLQVAADGVAIRGPRPWADVRAYGARGDGSADDRAAIQAAIDAAPPGGTVLIPNGTYLLGGPIDLSHGVSLVGTGWEYTDTPRGSVLRRANDLPMVTVSGSGATHQRNCRLVGLALDGGDKPADMVQLFGADFAMVDRCWFTNGKGRAIHAWSVFDSRIENCYFSYVGDPGGELPALDMRSGGSRDGKEMGRTDQLHVVGCDFEQFRGTAIATTPERRGDSMTSEIFLTNVKLESLSSNVELLRIENTTMVYLTNLTLTSQGSPKETIERQAKLHRAFCVQGTVFFEMVPGTPKKDVAQLRTFATIEESAAVELFGFFANGVDNLLDDVCVRTDLVNASSLAVRGRIVSRDAGKKRLSNLPHDDVLTTLALRSQSSDMGLRLVHDARPNDAWWLGRIVPEGAASRFRVMYNDTAVMEMLGTDALAIRPPLLLGAGDVAIRSGPGSPDGRVAAPVGSLYLRTDGGPGQTLWVKESGTGPRGWVPK